MEIIRHVQPIQRTCAPAHKYLFPSRPAVSTKKGRAARSWMAFRFFKTFSYSSSQKGWLVPVGALLSCAGRAWASARRFLQSEREICPSTDAFLGYLLLVHLWKTQGGRGVCCVDRASRFRGKKIPGFRRGNCVDDHSWFLELLKQGTTSWVAQNNGSLSFHSSGSRCLTSRRWQDSASSETWRDILPCFVMVVGPNPWCLWLATTSSQSLPPSSKGILSTRPSFYENIGPVGLGPPLH